jgi:hypothetical protein
MVYDVLMAWDRYQQDRQSGKLNPGNLNEDQLIEMMKRAKG